MRGVHRIDLSIGKNHVREAAPRGCGLRFLSMESGELGIFKRVRFARKDHADSRSQRGKKPDSCNPLHLRLHAGESQCGEEEALYAQVAARSVVPLGERVRAAASASTAQRDGWNAE